jgi:hypothetical protein
MAKFAQRAVDAVEPLRATLVSQRDAIVSDKKKAVDTYSLSSAKMVQCFQEAKDRVDAHLRKVAEEYAASHLATLKALDSRMSELKMVAHDLESAMRPIVGALPLPSGSGIVASSPSSSSEKDVKGDGGGGSSVPGGAPLECATVADPPLSSPPPPPPSSSLPMPMPADFAKLRAVGCQLDVMISDRYTAHSLPTPLPVFSLTASTVLATCIHR